VQLDAGRVDHPGHEVAELEVLVLQGQHVTEGFRGMVVPPLSFQEEIKT
jgi:hypothetical protein